MDVQTSGFAVPVAAAPSAVPEAPSEAAAHEAPVDMSSQPLRVVTNTRGTQHGGHLMVRADGTGVFAPTSYVGTAPHFAGSHNKDGHIEFTSMDDLATKLP